MDTFTTITAAMTLASIYFGERFRVGAYLLLGMMFGILLAWRMGEEIFYIATAGLLAVLVFRAFFSDEDVRQEGKFDDS